MASIYAIGQPVNESEREAIDYLAKNLPASYHIFHNLELPNWSGLPYEYDMIVVGGYAVYVVEVKGYGGRIVGNAAQWELESGKIYNSPFPVLNQKAKVVGDRLERGGLMGRKPWVQGIVVCTGKNLTVTIRDEQATRVLDLPQAVAFLQDPRKLPIRDPVPITPAIISKIEQAIVGQFRPLRPNEQMIGSYRVLEPLETTDLYVRLLAENPLLSTRNRYTLKIYTLDVGGSASKANQRRDRILHEAYALLRLNHPNIVKAQAPFAEENRVVVPLEWVEGYSLRGLLEAGTSIDLARKLDIMRQICEGLAAAHAGGVIHRDIRPDNIIVPKQGPVKLVNFDAARVEDDDIRTIATEAGRQLDPRYTAPEVWEYAGFASPASDQYGAGIILFELLTGIPPYQEQGEVRAAKGLPILPTAVSPELPTRVDALVARMCAFDVKNRYPDMPAALTALDEVKNS